MNNYIITRASDTNELYHHGVKGMKWGHRKSLPTSSLRNQVDSAKTTYKNAKKHIINLSTMLINIVQKHIVLAKSVVKLMMPDGRKIG